MPGSHTVRAHLRCCYPAIASRHNLVPTAHVCVFLCESPVPACPTTTAGSSTPALGFRVTGLDGQQQVVAPTAGRTLQLPDG